jgi:hypothetical protein
MTTEIDQAVVDIEPDLFGARPRRRKQAASLSPAQPPELTRARALCRQLQHTRALPDKRRMAHLICLNLKAMLRHTDR